MWDSPGGDGWMSKDCRIAGALFVQFELDHRLTDSQM